MRRDTYLGFFIRTVVGPRALRALKTLGDGGWKPLSGG